MIYVDANYWIYWFDERLPEHKYVVDVMRSAIEEGIVMNVITMLEIAYYLRFLPKAEFEERMRLIRGLMTLEIIPLDIALLDKALELLGEYAHLGIGARDSVILATMRELGLTRILTHDKSFRRIEWIEVIDVIP